MYHSEFFAAGVGHEECEHEDMDVDDDSSPTLISRLEVHPHRAGHVAAANASASGATGGSTSNGGEHLRRRGRRRSGQRTGIEDAPTAAVAAAYRRRQSGAHVNGNGNNGSGDGHGHGHSNGHGNVANSTDSADGKGITGANAIPIGGRGASGYDPGVRAGASRSADMGGRRESPPPYIPHSEINPSMNGNGSGNGHANANANIKGDWTVNKRYLILDKIITAGIATFDYNEMAAETGLTVVQLRNALQRGRAGNLRDKVLKSVYNM